MLRINKETCKVQLINGPTNFKTITVKLYLQFKSTKELVKKLTKELAKELAEELIEELAKELAEKLTKKLAKEPAKELAANAPLRKLKWIQ